MVKADILVQNKTVSNVSGKVEGEYSISTDSRTADEKDIFVALDGPNFKGIDFCRDCLKSGVCVFVLNDDSKSKAKEKQLKEQGHCFSVIYVRDTLAWLQEVARLHLLAWKEMGGVVIGVTGSNGKTTNKEMLGYLLNATFPKQVHCTSKNFNNHIGVPMTALGVCPNHKVVVIEMGTNHPGEMGTLCRIAPPSHGFITNIGESHLEFFHDRKGVFREKRALYDVVQKNGGIFVVNEDDEYLKTLNGVSFGLAGKDIKIILDGQGFRLHLSGESIQLENPHINGRFNHFNMGMCLALCLSVFPEKKDNLISAGKTFVPPRNNRAMWIERGGKRIFLDAYNANPSSMKVSLGSFLDELPDGESPLMVLGDMNELGVCARQLHEQVGRFLRGRSVKDVIFVGRYSGDYSRGFGKGAMCYKEVADLARDWPGHFARYRVFFIKGSRSLQLESLSDIIA